MERSLIPPTTPKLVWRTLNKNESNFVTQTVEPVLSNPPLDISLFQEKRW
jgi:hypothetical protein